MSHVEVDRLREVAELLDFGVRADVAVLSSSGEALLGFIEVGDRVLLGNFKLQMGPLRYNSMVFH